MTNTNDQEGLQLLAFTREQKEHFLFKRFERAITEERRLLQEQLEHPVNIESTTLMRGELRMLKRILARLEEVGPESRQSEPDGPESAPPAPIAGGFPVSFANDHTR